MNWLDSLRNALDTASSPVVFFFRNDDVGWEDGRLFELLYPFTEHGVPIDLAVIPKSLSRRTATRLRRLAESDHELLSVHQHGYAHLNHEQIGRKSEFGPTRAGDLQLADINAGKHLLMDLLGPIAEPIFIPPWNRCTATTAACLREAGFTGLSRDVTAVPLNVEGLMELPVSVDWFARRKNLRLTPNEIGDLLGAAASVQAPVGLMLHHAVMNDEERRRVAELLKLVSSHSQVRCVLMRDLVSPTNKSAKSRMPVAASQN